MPTKEQLHWEEQRLKRVKHTPPLNEHPSQSGVSTLPKRERSVITEVFLGVFLQATDLLLNVGMEVEGRTANPFEEKLKSAGQG